VDHLRAQAAPAPRAAAVSAAASAYPRSPQTTGRASAAPSGGSTRQEGAFALDSLDAHPTVTRVATEAPVLARSHATSAPALAKAKPWSASKVFREAIASAGGPPSPTPMRAQLAPLQVASADTAPVSAFAAVIACSDSLPAEISPYWVFFAPMADAIESGETQETGIHALQQVSPPCYEKAHPDACAWLFSDAELNTFSRLHDTASVESLPAPSSSVSGVKRPRSPIVSSQKDDIHDDVALCASPSKLARMLSMD
jgi:hypothetical protein